MNGPDADLQAVETLVQASGVQIGGFDLSQDMAGRTHPPQHVPMQVTQSGSGQHRLTVGVTTRLA